MFDFRRGTIALLAIAAVLMLAILFILGKLDPADAAERSKNGLYVGISGGYSAAVLGDIFGADGPGAAVIAGYDIQNGKLVVGPWVEYGYHWRDWAGVDVDVKGWAGGLRGGVLVSPSTLLYVTGGYTQVDWSLSGVGSTDGTGWLGGGGMEVDVGSGFAVGAEYRYTRLELDAFPGAHDNVQEGRLRLTYKFDTPQLAVPSFEAKPLK